MRFYIDFENVNAGGLKGIESLKADDAVIIYYSNNPNLSMETVQKMIQSKAKIEFQKLSDEIKNMNLKNALDIIILNDIARWISTNNSSEIIIITNDSGYDAAISSFSAAGQSIRRAATIAESTVIMAEDTTRNIKKIVSVSKISENPKPETESTINEQEIIALFKKELSEFASDKQKILNIIKNSKTRIEINNALSKIFSSTNVGIIMKALKPYIKELPGK